MHPDRPLGARRLSEFFAEPKNSHGASNVTGLRPKRRWPDLGPFTTADIVGWKQPGVAATGDVGSGGRFMRRAIG